MGEPAGPDWVECGQGLSSRDAILTAETFQAIQGLQGPRLVGKAVGSGSHPHHRSVGCQK